MEIIQLPPIPRLNFIKDDSGLRITLLNATATIVRTDAPNSECFQMRFDVGNDCVVADLSLADLQTIGLQCFELMPQLVQQQTATDLEDIYRRPARLLKDLDSRSIQLLLREIGIDVLLDFLWFMKDAELIKRVLRNMSERAAAMLMDDLDRQWRGKNPDCTTVSYAQRGREATQDLLKVVRRLTGEGKIPNVLGELI